MIRKPTHIRDEKDAAERHKHLMKNPEYAAKWNALTGALFNVLADLPADALPPSPQVTAEPK